MEIERAMDGYGDSGALKGAQGNSEVAWGDRACLKCWQPLEDLERVREEFGRGSWSHRHMLRA